MIILEIALLKTRVGKYCVLPGSNTAVCHKVVSDRENYVICELNIQMGLLIKKMGRKFDAFGERAKFHCYWATLRRL